MQSTVDIPTTKLSPDDLAEYDRHGFVLVKNVFNNDELSAVNADMDAYLASRDSGEAASAPAKGCILSLALTTDLASKFAEDHRVLDLLEPLVHPGIAIYSAKLVSKEPFDHTRCLWHQDDAYYTKHSQSNCRLSTYIALQDITVDQGCLQVIPGSHKRGLQNAEKQEGGTCSLAMVDPPDLSQSQYVPMEAGDMLIFSALLQHGSEGNPTARRRRAFIVSYQEATATAGNGKQWKILRDG